MLTKTLSPAPVTNMIFVQEETGINDVSVLHFLVRVLF